MFYIFCFVSFYHVRLKGQRNKYTNYFEKSKKRSELSYCFSVNRLVEIVRAQEKRKEEKGIFSTYWKKIGEEEGKQAANLEVRERSGRWHARGGGGSEERKSGAGGKPITRCRSTSI